MRISLITPPSHNIEPWVPIFEEKGVKVHLNAIHPECDFIINTSQAWIHLVVMFRNTFPHIPFINYTLDFYKTVWTAPNPHGYNWAAYRDIIKTATEVWCISNEVKQRLTEEGVDPNLCTVMKIWARFFDYPGKIEDKRYILNPMRAYVADKNFGWLDRACDELNIPVVNTRNGLSLDEFRKVIAECSFMCTEYHETSTGGLTLLEGYRLGKPSVVSDSPYEGVKDYLGDKAIYFDDNSYEDFKRVIKETWENPPHLDLKECEAYCDTHPTLEETVDVMIARMLALKERENENG